MCQQKSKQELEISEKDCDEEKETYSVSFSPASAFEWIHAGHWSCFLLARLSSCIFVNWPCLRQPLKDISLLESEGRQGCRPSWANSLVGVLGVYVSYVPEIEHSPSGSNFGVMCVSWLMWTFFPCGWGHVMWIWMCMCARALLQHVSMCDMRSPVKPSTTAWISDGGSSAFCHKMWKMEHSDNTKVCNCILPHKD